MTPNTERALQALEEAIPPHLRSNRHGEGFLGERYETLRAFILAASPAPLRDDATRPSMSMFASAADYNAAMDKWFAAPSGIEADGDGGKLHAAIMNLPSEAAAYPTVRDNAEWLDGYAHGHRDALYAAAELALSPTSPPNGKTEGDAGGVGEVPRG